MAHIHFDSDEVATLAADLSRAPGRIQRRAPKVFEVGAFKIKKGMRQDAEGHDYLSGLPSQLEYQRFGDLDYEIGYNKSGQGNLANFAAFGSINNAPILDLTAPLRRELPVIQSHLADEGEDAVLGKGAQR